MNFRNKSKMNATLINEKFLNLFELESLNLSLSIFNLHGLTWP